MDLAFQRCGRHVGHARHNGQVSPSGPVAILGLLCKDFGRIGLDFRLQNIGPADFLRLEEVFGCSHAFLADAEQMLGQFEGTLGHEDIVKGASHVALYPLLLRRPGVFGLADRMFGHVSIALQLAGGDKLLTDETPLLPGLPIVADLIGPVADAGIGIETRLQPFGPGRLHPRRGMGQCWIVPLGNPLQLGQGHAIGHDGRQWGHAKIVGDCPNFRVSENGTVIRAGDGPNFHVSENGTVPFYLLGRIGPSTGRCYRNHKKYQCPNSASYRLVSARNDEIMGYFNETNMVDCIEWY